MIGSLKFGRSGKAWRLAPFVLAALLASPLSAWAQSGAKIGYFDVKRILAEVEDAKEVKARLQRDFDAKQKKLDQQRTELEKLGKELEQKAPVLSQAAKEQAFTDYQRKVGEAQKLLMEIQGDLAQQEQQALIDILGRLEPVVREIAVAEGYTYVFEKNEAGLFFGPGEHDLTAQVIRKYNQRYPAGGGKAKAPAKSGGGKK